MFEHILPIEHCKYQFLSVSKQFSITISIVSLQYFLVVLILLIAEFGICLTITMWPQCLGLNLDETVMVKALQGTYGVPGKEQVRIK